MAFQQKENSGALFKNSKKTSANHPDYTGKLDVHGASFRLAGWIKTSQNGKSYLSLAISEDTRGDKHLTDEEQASGVRW